MALFGWLVQSWSKRILHGIPWVAAWRHCLRSPSRDATVSQLSQFLNAWKVRSIEVLPDNEGVEVEFVVEGHEPFRFRTRKFGIGKRGARSAALAKFASRAGYGEVEELFRHIVSLPRDTVGGIFYP